MFRKKYLNLYKEKLKKVLESPEYFDLASNQIDVDSILLEGSLANTAKDLATSTDYDDYIRYIELEIAQINDRNFQHIWINADMPILITFCRN